MTEAREAILGAIRRSLGRAPSNTARQETQPPSVSRDDATSLSLRPNVEGDPSALFVRRMTAAGASLVQIPSLDAVPQAVRAFLDAHQLDHTLVRADEPEFKALPWPDGFTVSVRAAADADRTTLTRVVAAVAETGSLVVASSRRSPNTLHFLPENHIAVVRASQILRHLEDVWLLMRERLPDMPRALTFITGPSRTADIEQTLQIGAHGPRRLHVLLADD